MGDFPARIERCWRVIATAFCFTVFGLGGLLLRVFVFPLLGILVRNAVRRRTAARALVSGLFRAFARLMVWVGVMRYEFIGAERLQRRGLLVLANHPTLIDVVVLVAHIPDADCVVRGGLARNPFTRGPVRAAGYICNDGGEELLAACIASLRAGGNLVLFPEGTRSKPGQPLQLQRGAANIAIRGRRDITPVRIHCDQPFLVKGQKWYRVPERRPNLRFVVEDDIAVTGFASEGSGEALAARALTAYLGEYLSAHLESGRHAGA